LYRKLQNDIIKFMSKQSTNLRFLAKYKPLTWVAFLTTSNKIIAEAKSLSQLSGKITNTSKKITVMMIPPKESFAPKSY